MYYEERRPERRRTRYDGPGPVGRLVRLLISVVVIWAIAAAGWTVIVDHGWTQVLLLGVDYDAEGTSRSDAMIVASIGPMGQVRLTSILRDTWVEIPGHGWGKINAAYRSGGAELAVETVNAALGTHISRHVVISLRAFPLLIDTLGGVEMDVSEAELAETNANLAATRRLLEKTGVDTSPLGAYGEKVRLTGAQALSFARIRSIGSDYARTTRQRRVLQAMLEKARHTWNPVTLVRFFRQAFDLTDTDLSWPHMAALGVFALIRGDVREMRLPADGTFDSGVIDGVWSIRPDWAANRRALEAFLQ